MEYLSPKLKNPWSFEPENDEIFTEDLLSLFLRTFLYHSEYGILSEAAASVVDRQLGLNVVLRTEIVRLAAPSFHYGYWARMRAKNRNGRFPKISSFQMFVENFKATEAIPQFEASYTVIAPEMRAAFQREFERMVILDYADKEH